MKKPETALRTAAAVVMICLIAAFMTLSVYAEDETQPDYEQAQSDYDSGEPVDEEYIETEYTEAQPEETEEYTEDAGFVSEEETEQETEEATEEPENIGAVESYGYNQPETVASEQADDHELPSVSDSEIITATALPIPDVEVSDTSLIGGVASWLCVAVGIAVIAGVLVSKRVKRKNR